MAQPKKGTQPHVSEYEMLRRKNIEDNQAMLAKLMADLKDEFPAARPPVQSPPRKTRRRASESIVIRRNPCRSTRFNPVSTRSGRQRRGSVSSSVSSSSASVSPLSSPEKLVVRFGFFQKKSVGEDDTDSIYMPEDEDEEGCLLPSPKRKHRVDREIKSVDEITEEDLELVATHVSEKRYDSFKGTSCHQCRQKTDDMKTICRSDRCTGVRGQFCGPCLKNRYGEDAKEALKNPDWFCPACRGICNCSFCRKKKGRSCTGIMIHLARDLGYNNVNDYLQRDRIPASKNDVYKPLEESYDCSYEGVLHVGECARYSPKFEEVRKVKLEGVYFILSFNQCTSEPSNRQLHL